MERSEDDAVVVLAVTRAGPLASASASPSPTIDLTELDTDVSHLNVAYPVPPPHYTASWAAYDSGGSSKRQAVASAAAAIGPAAPPLLSLTQLSKSLTHKPPRRRKRQQPSVSCASAPSLSPSFPLPLSHQSLPFSPRPSASVPRVDRLSVLPSDLLKEMISFLDGAEAFFSLSSLSRLFSQLLQSASAAFSLLVASTVFDFSAHSAHVNQRSLQRCLASSSPLAITTVSLASCSRISSSALSASLSALTSLLRLDLSRTRILPVDLCLILAQCSALRDLRVDLSQRPLPPSSPHLLDAMRAVSNLQSLTALDLAGLGLADSVMLTVGRREESGGSWGQAGIRALSLHHSSLGNHSLLQMPWLLSSQLLYLDLSYTALASGLLGVVPLPALRYLNVATRSHSSLTSADVCRLLLTSPQLQHLDLSNHTNVQTITGAYSDCTAVSSPVFPYAPVYPQLRSLCLDGCYRLSRPVPLSLLPKHFPALTSLSLAACQLTDSALLSLCEAALPSTSSSSLLTLRVPNNIALTNGSVLRCLQVLTRLRLLCVAGCPFVNDEALSEWMRRQRASEAVMLGRPGAVWGEERQRLQQRRRYCPPHIERQLPADAEVVINRMDSVLEQ